MAAPLVYPIWGIIQSVVNQAISNYNSYTLLFEKRMSHGLQFPGIFRTRGGAVPTEYAPAGGNWVSDKNNPRYHVSPRHPSVFRIPVFAESTYRGAHAALSNAA